MSAGWLKALVLVLIFASVLLAVETVVGWIASSRAEGRAINLRLKLIGSGVSRIDTLNRLRRSEGSFAAALPPVLAVPARRFERMLVTARLTIPTAAAMLLLLLAPLALFALMLILVAAAGGSLGFGRVLLIATFSVVLAGVLPLMLIQVRATRMRKKMQDQFPVALDVFVRGLRAGHPVAAALDLLTVEMPDPIGSEFGIVVDEVTYGADLRDALQAMADRWNMEDMRMFVVSLAVQAETGGNLAEILENLSRVIRERASMMMKVRALSSEGRMSAIMLTALPILAFLSLFLLNPPFYLGVADDPLFVPGFVALILLYLVGVVAIRRMIDLKV